MKTAPEDLEQDDIIRSLEEGWGLEVERAAYVAEGFGSYHWAVVDVHGARHFATADDLEQKQWLGSTPESAFAGLKIAFDTALALRIRGGLRFVVAPRSSLGGESVRRLGSRYSVSLFPYVLGRSGHFDQPAESDERSEVVGMLAQLHEATPIALPVARRLDLALSGRQRLESCLQELGTVWQGGPFSEPARSLVAAHAGTVMRLLGAFDRLVAQVEASDKKVVITHGEPHSGNLVRTDDGLVLVDWDTVGVALPERDLWMLVSDGGDELAQYTDATGTEPDPTSLALYRLRWDLDDISIFLHQFRQAHRRDEDTELAWFVLNRYFDEEDRWQSVLG
jgi:spectinomycin phosphotransferase